MSGGYFEYRDRELDDFADELQDDIDYNGLELSVQRRTMRLAGT